MKFESDSIIRYWDLHTVEEAHLRRLLEFALDHDPSGPRIRREESFATKAEILVQLVRLGVIG